MQNVLTFPAFNEGKSNWCIFKGIAPNHMIGYKLFNPLNAELNPIYHLLALLGAHLIFHVSGLRAKTKTFHKSNENLYAAESGHTCSQVGQTHCQLFFKEALFRNSSRILCFRK